MRSQKIGGWGRVVMTAILLSSCITFDVEPRSPRQDNFISRAVFASGRLWLLTDAGYLSSVAPGRKARMDAGLRKPALDICVSNGQLKALTCAKETCAEWSLRTWTDGRWSAGAAIPSLGDHVAAMNCGPGLDTVVTDQRLVNIAGGMSTSVALSERLETGVVTSIHTTVDHVFVGINAGEWGGGLRSIDAEPEKLLS
ncbi:MAG: hypothetical protein J2P21_24430 [Chloracidobacterium sp.]|nr:hypothetical protein [Chloracidobacterium sp.]